MPFPSSDLGQARPDLTGGLEEFDIVADRQGFIGAQVLPVRDVATASGRFGKITVESLLQNVDTRRAPTADYAESEWKFEPETFATEEHGFQMPIDEHDEAVYEDWFDLEQMTADIVRDVVLRNYEKRVAAAIFNATTWTGASLTTAVTNEWDDVTNATPIVDVNAAADYVYANSGLRANAIIMNAAVFRNLRLTDNITAKIASTGAGASIVPGRITRQQIAECLDLDYVLVAGASYNTSNEGQSAAFGRIWSNEYAMVCRIATTANIKEPCIGRTIHWGGDGSQFGGTIETFGFAKNRSNYVRCRHEVQEKVLYVQAGHLLSNITT